MCQFMNDSYSIYNDYKEAIILCWGSYHSIDEMQTVNYLDST